MPLHYTARGFAITGQPLGELEVHMVVPSVFRLQVVRGRPNGVVLGSWDLGLGNICLFEHVLLKASLCQLLGFSISTGTVDLADAKLEVSFVV